MDNLALADQIPPDWQTCPLNEILAQQVRQVEVEPNGVYRRLGVRWYADGPFLKDVATGDKIKGRYLYRVEPDDFIYNRLFAWKGSFGVVGEDMRGCVVSNEFPLFQVDHGVAFPEFIWRWFSLPQIWKMIENKSSGTTRTSRLRYREEDLLHLEIPIPPLHEQHAIACVLRTVQRAKEATEKVIAAYRRLKQSLMGHLFTYGPVPFDRADKVELEETEIGPVPEHWKVASLDAAATLFQYGTSARCGMEARGLPVLRIPNVISDVIDTSDLKYLECEEKEAKKLLLQKGDLLFVRTNGRREYVGRCAVYDDKPERSLFASYLIRVRPRHEVVLPHFVQMYSTTASGQNQLPGRASGAADGKFNINTQTLRSVMLPVPPLHEQQEIMHIVQSVQHTQDAAGRRHTALTTLFNTLLHDLMTGKVRVV